MASETNNGDTETKKRDVWTSKEMEILEGVATKIIKEKNHKNHKRSESSRKKQPVGEKKSK